ncbi:MAG: hypothetical protein SOW01_04440 [Mediterranea sp.]|nr:hypothetical protein [Mediterranea sp.]
MFDKYFNIGDIVTDSSGEVWEVLSYLEVFDGTLSMKETEVVSCRNQETKCIKHINQNELFFVKSNSKPFIID